MPFHFPYDIRLVIEQHRLRIRYHRLQRLVVFRIGESEHNQDNNPVDQLSNTKDVEIGVKEGLSTDQPNTFRNVGLSQALPHSSAKMENQSAGNPLLSQDPIQTAPNNQVVSSEPALDEDNHSLHEKVDRLVVAAKNGHHVRFVPNSETGDFDVFASKNGHDTQGSRYRLGRRISLPYENSKRTIKRANSAGLSNSPAGAGCPSDSESPGPDEEGPPKTWEDLVAAADRRFDIGPGEPDQGRTPIRIKVPNQEMEVKTPSGRHLFIMGQTEVERHTISPIHLNLHTSRKLITPSIHSQGSEQDCSSPLFPKSCETKITKAYQEFPPCFRKAIVEKTHAKYSDTDDLPPKQLIEPDREANKTVLAWLRRTTSPLQLGGPLTSRAGRSLTSKDSDTDSKESDKDFDVWEDVDDSETASKKSVKVVALPSILRNVTNLRRTGYLQHNSFSGGVIMGAKKKKIFLVKKSPPEKSRELVAHDSSRAYIAKHWPHAVNFIDRAAAVPERIATVSATLRGHKITNSVSQVESSASYALEAFTEILPGDNPGRAAGFAHALARLEGHVAPEPPSPVKRYINPGSWYDSDVEVEDIGPELEHPRPSRMVRAGTGVARLEAAVEFEFGLPPSVPAGYSVSPDGRLMQRPENPTPERAQQTGKVNNLNTFGEVL